MDVPWVTLPGGVLRTPTQESPRIPPLLHLPPGDSGSPGGLMDSCSLLVCSAELREDGLAGRAANENQTHSKL